MGTVEATADFGNVVSSGLLARRDQPDEAALHINALCTEVQ